MFNNTMKSMKIGDEGSGGRKVDLGGQKWG